MLPYGALGVRPGWSYSAEQSGRHFQNGTSVSHWALKCFLLPGQLLGSTLCVWEELHTCGDTESRGEMTWCKIHKTHAHCEHALHTQAKKKKKGDSHLNIFGVWSIFTISKCTFIDKSPHWWLSLMQPFYAMCTNLNVGHQERLGRKAQDTNKNPTVGPLRFSIILHFSQPHSHQAFYFPLQTVLLCFEATLHLLWGAIKDIYRNRKELF